VNGKKARALRKLVGLDLSTEEARKIELVDTGMVNLIGIISHDGNHGSREEKVLRLATNEQRYLYRQLKKVYNGMLEPDLQEQVLSDVADMKNTEKTDS
jgi:hypothetical protein